jgi:multicomponent Na+:H+ antiporter subunit G
MTGLLESVLVAVMLTVGTFFLGIGTIGLIRFPDVYNRLHATSKATTLGAASMFLAGFVWFGPGGAGLTSIVGIVFLFLTAPTGAHMISRAAQRMGVEFYGPAGWPEEPPEPGGDED